MKYERNPRRLKSTRSLNYTTGGRSYISKRYNNTRVKKALTTKKVVKPAAKTNKNAIMVLSKQVRSLQMARYGFKQWQHKNCVNPSGTVLALAPTKASPVGFMVNDFYNDAMIWQGTVANGVPVTVQAGKFTRVVSSNGLNAQYNWNNKQQGDLIDSVQYMPVTSKFHFRILTNTGPSTPIVKVRFQFFTFKNAIQGGAVSVSLPANLGAYLHLQDDNPSTRNHLNTHDYHKLLLDKTVMFKQTTENINLAQKFLECKIYHPAVPIKGDLSAGEVLYNQIPSKNQIWCVISTDMFTANGVFVNAERWDVWRDTDGIGS